MNNVVNVLKAQDGPQNSFPAEPTADQRRELLERIAASAKFRRAERLRHLLLFLDTAAENHSATELEIATKVFHRGRDYAPSEDSIVRVTMRQLRFKLNEYFEDEGREEPWVIQVPKGEYALHYQRRDSAPAPIQEDMDRPKRRSLVHWALAAALTASVALNVWFASRTDPRQEQTLLSAFCPAGAKLTVVASDGALPLLRRILGTQIDEVQHDRRTIAQQLRQHGDTGIPANVASWYLNDPAVPFAHANAAAYLLRSRHARGEPGTMRHAPGMQVRDFHEGNLAVIGSEWTNVWAGLFEKRLNFRFEVAGKPAGGGASFINLRPSAGELDVYRGEKPAHNWGKTYSRVAVVANLSNTGTVFLIAGLDMYGTQAAAEFLASADGHRAYRDFLKSKGLAQTPHFEILLATTAMDGVPTRPEMVAWRPVRTGQ